MSSLVGTDMNNGSRVYCLSM